MSEPPGEGEQQVAGTSDSSSPATRPRWKRFAKYAVYALLIYLVVVTAIAFIRPLV